MSLPDIDAMLFLKLLREPLSKKIVEIVAAEPVVAMTGQHLGNVAFDSPHGNVERAAAQVIDQRGVTRPVAVAIGEASGGGLIQDANDLEPGQRAGFASGAALRVGEIGRHSDDGCFPALAESG